MDYATSMYLGGVIINAADCNYESSRELGTRCPCCGEAVFLRAGSIRDNTLRNKKKVTQLIRPAFVHYKGNGFFDDCEKRIYSKETKEKMAQLEMEARNQRLELYNKRLWEMFSSIRCPDKKTQKRFIGIINKMIGANRIDSWAIAFRKSFALFGDEIFPYLEDSFMFIFDRSIDEVLTSAESFAGSPMELDREAMEFHREYFNHGCDPSLHLAVCNEIAEFLRTRTSGYFWRKMTYFLILQLIQDDEANKNTGGYYSDKNYLLRRFEQLLVKNDNHRLSIIVNLIVSTHWLKAINKELGKEN